MDSAASAGYGFEHMSALDHERLFESGSAPTTDELAGVWRLDGVANSNSAPGITWLQFDVKPDGRLETRCQLYEYRRFHAYRRHRGNETLRCDRELKRTPRLLMAVYACWLCCATRVSILQQLPYDS